MALSEDCTGGRRPPRPLRLLDHADSAWRESGPTGRAVRAFGVRAGELRRAPAGVHAWTDGRLFLKPVGCIPEHAWVCEVYANWTATHVRVPEPVLPRGPGEAGWSSDGWGAQVVIRGRDTGPDELDRVKEASDAFHACIRDLPRPGFMDDRDDPFAFGDRLAWEGIEPEGDEETLAVIERLRKYLAPVAGRPQVIHGDIVGNVMLVDGHVPAVIDWPPYFRPVGMANAIAVTDAVTFRAAPLSLLDEWSSGEDWNQLLVRALLYRLGPTGIFAVRNRLMGILVTHVRHVRPVVDAVVSRLEHEVSPARPRARRGCGDIT
jgi:Phosphotransferase enzyme family